MYWFVSTTIATASFIGLMCVCSSTVCWVRTGEGCGEQWLDASPGGYKAHRAGQFSRCAVKFQYSAVLAKRQESETSATANATCSSYQTIYGTPATRKTLQLLSRARSERCQSSQMLKSGMLGETGIRGHEQDEKGCEAGVLADSGKGTISDGR